METLQINILDPKAKKLLKDLADQKLIEIQPAEASVLDAYSRIRSKYVNNPISEEEISMRLRTFVGVGMGPPKLRVILDTNHWLSLLISKPSPLKLSFWRLFKWRFFEQIKN